MKLLTVGGATQDIFIKHRESQVLQLNRNNQIDSYVLLPQGAKLDVESLQYHVGGGATNSAVSFKRLGFDVRTIFKIADDCPGTYIYEQLSKADIVLKHIIKAERGTTGTSFIINSPPGDSTILAFRGINAHMKIEEISLDALMSCEALYITSLSGDSSSLLLPLVQKAKERNIFIATNPGTSQLKDGALTLRQALSYLDVFILNSQEAQQFMLTLVQENVCLKEHKSIKTVMNSDKKPNLLKSLLLYNDTCFNIAHYFAQVSSYGPKIVVVTNGAEGVYAYHEGIIYFHPSLKLSMVNTVGAGDAFGSCFVGSLLNGASVWQAIINGIINSASVLSFPNAQEGLLSWDQINNKAQTIGMRHLEQFLIE